jgi:DNA-binding ferritin-like protein (Dps family)
MNPETKPSKQKDIEEIVEQFHATLKVIEHIRKLMLLDTGEATWIHQKPVFDDALEFFETNNEMLKILIEIYGTQHGEDKQFLKAQQLQEENEGEYRIMLDGFLDLKKKGMLRG